MFILSDYGKGQDVRCYFFALISKSPVPHANNLINSTRQYTHTHTHTHTLKSIGTDYHTHTYTHNNRIHIHTYLSDLQTPTSIIREPASEGERGLKRYH